MTTAKDKAEKTAREIIHNIKGPLDPAAWEKWLRYIDAREVELTRIIAKALLKQEKIIEALEAGLKFYATGSHLLRESEHGPYSVCAPVGARAKDCLELAEKLRGEP